jgi:hypothetical protein
VERAVTTEYRVEAPDRRTVAIDERGNSCGNHERW